MACNFTTWIPLTLFLFCVCTSYSAAPQSKWLVLHKFDVAGAVLANQSYSVTNAVEVFTPVGDPGPMTRCGTCECPSHNQCGCCTQFIVQRFDYDKQGCLNFTYNATEVSISVNLLISNYSLFEASFSGSNPPPLCVPIPQLPLVAICIRLYNVHITEGHISVCLNLELQIQGFTIFIFQFDCIEFKRNGITLFKPPITPAHTSLLQYKTTS